MGLLLFIFKSLIFVKSWIREYVWRVNTDWRLFAFDFVSKKLWQVSPTPVWIQTHLFFVFSIFVFLFFYQEISNYPNCQTNLEHRLYHREEFLTDPFWFMAPVGLSVCDRSLARCAQKIVSQQVLPQTWWKALFICVFVLNILWREYFVDNMSQRKLIFKEQRNVFLIYIIYSGIRYHLFQQSLWL